MSLAKQNGNEPYKSHEQNLMENLISAIITARDQPVYLKIESVPGGGLSISHVQFLSTQELAAFARVETRTVRIWHEKGIGPTAYRVPGSKGLLFDLAETLSFIKSHPVDQNGSGHR